MRSDRKDVLRDCVSYHVYLQDVLVRTMVVIVTSSNYGLSRAGPIGCIYMNSKVCVREVFLLFLSYYHVSYTTSHVSTMMAKEFNEFFLLKILLGFDRNFGLTSDFRKTHHFKLQMAIEIEKRQG